MNNLNKKNNKNKETIEISLEDLDKQLEFYNKTLNQYEILNHNYTLKLNSLQKENNNLKNQKNNLTKQNKNLKEENERIKKENIVLNRYKPKIELKRGIEVLVPTYKAEEFVLKFLDSMKKQTLDYALFEVLFVINGERDNTENLIRQFMKENPKINITIIESEPGATTARNKGIDVLSREYVVFIDVDDFISPKYLEEAYKHCAPNRIIIGDYYDIDENTGEISETYFTRSFKGKKGIIDPYEVSQGALLIATNKIMPTLDIKNVKFKPELKSGDDHEYFCNLYSKFDYEFYFVGNDCDAIYYRLVVSNSVSRQPMSYDFNIIQRLEVMKRVDDMLENLENKNMEKLLDLTINSSQITFIVRYLEKYPEQYVKVLNEIKKYDLKHFDYDGFKNRTISLMLKTISNNKTEINALKTNTGQPTNSEINEIKIENQSLKNNEEKLNTEIKNLKNNEEKLNNEIKKLKKDNDDLIISNKKLLAAQRKITEDNIIDLKKQNELLLISNKELLNQNNKLLNSKSWKYTEPLRKIRNE